MQDTYTVARGLEEALRILDPSVTILDKFVEALEREAHYAAKYPKAAPHFVQRVCDDFMPVFNMICSNTHQGRTALLGVEKALNE